MMVATRFLRTPTPPAAAGVLRPTGSVPKVKKCFSKSKVAFSLFRQFSFFPSTRFQPKRIKKTSPVFHNTDEAEMIGATKAEQQGHAEADDASEHCSFGRGDQRINTWAPACS